MEEIDDKNIIINDQDGLPNVHPNLIPEADIDSSGHNSEDEFEGLPSSLIVTNIHESVFGSTEKRREIEDLFRIFDPDVTFQWLKSFKRLRVNFQTAPAAANARIQLHQYRINESVITCYFAQPVTPVKNHLQPPAPYKQFLISPPASPPLDWEPRPEGEPIVNTDLIAALASLAPGSSCELHPPGPGQPGIVVHTALGVPTADATGGKPKIMQTACPERS
ncbi:protein sarah [Cylas formicarius]|uniref:protein sarah n=1 Tax=Cylas formicarius TaxID=197179 RepID=UPI002958908F|nr:protein sarah [Cylas formicarius]